MGGRSRERIEDIGFFFSEGRWLIWRSFVRVCFFFVDF